MSEATNYTARELLSDGSPIEIRALRPEDEADMLAAIGQTSAQSLQRRFFVMKRHFSDKERAFFMDIDFKDHVAIVALADEAGRKAIVGGGRYIVFEPGRAEMAFVVIDAWQGRGVGSILMRHLMKIAGDAGLQELTAEVLPENAAMLKVFGKFGFRPGSRRDPQTVHLELKLAERETASSADHRPCIDPAQSPLPPRWTAAWTRGATASHRSVRSRRNHIERHGEYDVDEDQQSPNEPRRTTAVRDEGGRHGSDRHHRHCTRPKLQIHRLGPDDVTEQDKYRCNEQRDLGSASERYADAHIQPVLARGRNRHRHFSRSADECDDAEPDESRAHPQRHRRLLHRLHEDFAYQRHKDRNSEQCADREVDRPLRLRNLAMIFAREEFLVRLQREKQTQSVCHDEQDGDRGAEVLGHQLAARQIEFGDRCGSEESNRTH